MQQPEALPLQSDAARCSRADVAIIGVAQTCLPTSQSAYGGLSAYGTADAEANMTLCEYTVLRCQHSVHAQQRYVACSCWGLQT